MRNLLFHLPFMLNFIRYFVHLKKNINFYDSFNEVNECYD